MKSNKLKRKNRGKPRPKKKRNDKEKRGSPPPSPGPSSAPSPGPSSAPSPEQALEPSPGITSRYPQIAALTLTLLNRAVLEAIDRNFKPQRVNLFDLATGKIVFDGTKLVHIDEMEKSKAAAEKREMMLMDLDKAMSNSDYDRAYKVCNRLLHLSPDDELAFRCKIICCVLLDKVSDAITFIDKNPKLSGNLTYEKAYCHYRTQDMKAAREVLEKCEDSVRKKELMTQILYRVETYDQAYNSCKEVIRVAEDEYEEERQTNLAAINASLISNGDERRLNKAEFDTHELRYNMGCAVIAEENYEQAIKLLKEAESKAVETLKDDGLTEEEIAEDTAIITIQLGYCLHKLGKEKEALALYSKVLKNKPDEPDLVAVASNNILCINRDQNIFDSKKRVKAIRADGADAKLTCAQRRDMYINQCLFYLLTGQADLCKETCALTMSKFPETQREIFLIETALIVKTDGPEAAKKHAAPILKKNDFEALRLNLCFVQQLLRDGKRKDAINTLEGLVKNSYKPGIIGALVTLYQQDGRVNDAAIALKQAVDFYRKEGGSKKRLNMLWRQAASLMIQQGDLAEAVKSLEELRKTSPDDITTLAQLIVAYAQYDITKAHKLSKELPAVSPPKDLDIATLESPNWLASVKMKKSTKADSVPSTPLAPNTKEESKISKKKKKTIKCKSKQPREYDPERKPDPERWLPKYERTGYRPKKQRRGKVDVGKGTQGADSATSAIYDMSAKVGQKKEAEPSPSSSRAKPSKRNKDKSGKK